MVKVIVAGDLCPIGINQGLFQKGDASAILNDLQPVFEGADFSVVNLECPLIENETPIEKSGPNLGAPISCVNGLIAAKIGAVNLANNHIMDHGEEGLRSTLSALSKSGIPSFGAGESLSESRRLFIRSFKGVRIAFCGLAEHEFGIADKEKAGSNPFDVIDFVRNTRKNRDAFDALIVIVHGGNERYPYPRPNLMDACRFLVEQGANAVICQHSHCAGCMEYYQGAPIIYGQGNFIFDMPAHSGAWHEGALISIDVDMQGKCHAELVPFRQSDGRPGARLMTEDQEADFRRGFESRSKSILDESFVKDQWEAFCRKKKASYLNALHGRPSLLRRLAGKLDMLHYLDRRAYQLKRLNLIRCESHREVLVTLLSMQPGREKTSRVDGKSGKKDA